MTLSEAVQLALDIAQHSPCLSKRGVVIFDHIGAISLGFNHQPSPFICTHNAACKATCGKTAIHAEQSALLEISSGHRRRLPNAQLVHVKAIDGVLVPSGPPSCLECSKLILEARIARVWLFHEQGWREYSAVDFHEASASYHGCAIGYFLDKR